VGGAFTGARSRGKLGKFELASGGTLFLDEIGDMPLHLQGSLLRVLQTNELVRVGGTLPVAVNARVVCATNRSLPELARTGRFRQDLYYRLGVLPIGVAPLRDRSDIEFLARELLTRIAARLDAVPKALSRKEIATLVAHQWPGNVRELENVLTRFIVTGRLTTLITTPRPEQEPIRTPQRLKQRIQSQTATEIRGALEQSGGNKRRAAEHQPRTSLSTRERTKPVTAHVGAQHRLRRGTAMPCYAAFILETKLRPAMLPRA
jgi:transcriptional regulator with PAS, ATPase and Fis domain